MTALGPERREQGVARAHLDGAAGPSIDDGHDMERCLDSMERILATRETRIAWLMGFLAGSAVLDDLEGTDAEGARQPAL